MAVDPNAKRRVSGHSLGSLELNFQIPSTIPTAAGTAEEQQLSSKSKRRCSCSRCRLGIAAATGPLLDMAAAEDFIIYNETQRVLIRTRCRTAIYNPRSHLRAMHKTDIGLGRRRATIDRFAGRAESLLDAGKTTPADMPRPDGPPVPHVQIYRDGFACSACPKVSAE
ncbi:hypothetical protein MMC21_003005 [Puttea exsequens]|nr:hypothetical protein [Puttea exsequens]